MTHAGFLLAEDAAIKARFANISVSDDKNPTRVAQVFFRYPEGEKEKEYPFITIEHLGIVHNRALQHSEQNYYYSNTVAGASVDPNYIDYFPSELDAAGMASELGSAKYLRTESFVPVTLIYQVATYARSAIHDRQLTSKIMRRVAPFRRGFIEIPADGTIRRFDLISWSNSDLLDGESGYRKRVFRKVYTIHMSAEIAGSDLVPVKQVTSVVGNIENADNQNPSVFTTPFSEVF
jgi:hypothetical protein